MSPRWTLEYCIAMSTLSEDFHKAVHYGKMIFNAREHIALTSQKIEEANQDVAKEEEQWEPLSQAEMAYNIYSLMLNDDGSSSLKSIVAQCFASMLKWKISVIPGGSSQEKMFDLDLYGWRIDEEKRLSLKEQLEKDNYLKYIVDAIKYASSVH